MLQLSISNLVPFVALASALVSVGAGVYAAFSTYANRRAQNAANDAIELLLNTQSFTRVVISVSASVVSGIDIAKQYVDNGKGIDETQNLVQNARDLLKDAFLKMDIIEEKLRQPYIAGIPSMQREVGGAISEGRKKLEELDRKMVDLDLSTKQAELRKSLAEQKVG